jgi:hypothetical protein
MFKVSITDASQNDDQELNESQEDGHKDFNDPKEDTEGIGKKSRIRYGRNKHPRNVS